MKIGKIHKIYINQPKILKIKKVQIIEHMKILQN